MKNINNVFIFLKYSICMKTLLNKGKGVCRDDCGGGGRRGSTPTTATAHEDWSMLKLERDLKRVIMCRAAVHFSTRKWD